MNILTLRMKSRCLGGHTTVNILLPAGPLAIGEKLPVLWLLHGATGDCDTFLYNEQIHDALLGRRCMTVLPSGLNSDYADHMEFAGGYAFTDFFFTELMPYIQAMFPASAASEDNYLAGYSMGGAGALMLGLERPELFGRVAVLGASVRESEFLKPYRHLSGEQFRALATAEPRRFPTEYGKPENGILLKEVNMIARYPSVGAYIDSMECTWERFADRAGEGRLPRLLFCCGTKDGCYAKVELLRSYAESLGVTDIVYDYLPGFDHAASPQVIARAIELLGL